MKLQGLTQPSFKKYFNQISSELSAKKNKPQGNKNFAIKHRILVVDDEWNMLKLLYSYLSGEYELIAKNSPIEALKWLQEGNSPSLIICEFELPHFSSALFIQTVKTSGLYKNIPIVILSDTDGFQDKLKGLSFTVEGTISKPFDPGQLKNIINKIVNGNEPRLHY